MVSKTIALALLLILALTQSTLAQNLPAFLLEKKQCSSGDFPKAMAAAYDYSKTHSNASEADLKSILETKCGMEDSDAHELAQFIIQKKNQSPETYKAILKLIPIKRITIFSLIGGVIWVIGLYAFRVSFKSRKSSQ